VTGRLLVVAAVAAGLTALAVPLCIVLARRTGVMDRPGHLKVHRDPVPYLGGLAVFAGMVAGAVGHHPVTLVPVAGALALGVLDDRFDLDPRLRLVGQVAVGAGIAATQPLHLAGWSGALLLVVVTVVLINGCNLLDGLDLLAAGVGLGLAVGFAGLDTGTGRYLGASLAGATVAFLAYNRPPARIYLGDGGSYLLGASATVLLAGVWAPGVPTPTGVLALALVAVPVAELACAVLRRRRQGRSLLAGDRGHPYDRLVDRGWPRPAASAVYIGAEGVVAMGVVLLARRHPSMAVAVTADGVVAVALLAGAYLAGGMGTTGLEPAA